MASEIFENAFGYQYSGSSSTPRNQVGSIFEAREDFTNCATAEQSAVDKYVNKYVFPSNTPFTGYKVETIQNDLISTLNPLLTGGLMDGWQTKTYSPSFPSMDGSKNLAVNAVFIYTVVNATDGKGDPQPWLFLYGLGGYYDSQTL